MTRTAWVGLATAITACTSTSTLAPPSPPPPPLPGATRLATAGPTTATPGTAELLGALGTLVGVVASPAHLAAWAQKIDHEQAPLDSYLDELLATERFGREVIPSLVFAAFVNVRNYYALPSAFVLKHPSDPSGPLYLRAPCSITEAITVRPWSI